MNGTARLSREGGNLLTLVHAIWRDSDILKMCIMKQLLISLQEFQSRLSRSFLGVRIFNAQIFNVHLLATAQEHNSISNLLSHCYAEQVWWVSRVRSQTLWPSWPSCSKNLVHHQPGFFLFLTDRTFRTA